MRPLFSIPFTRLKNKILSRHYALSLAFINQETSRRLNTVYRREKRPTDVLSFPLSRDSGEILIDLATARIEARKFKMPFEKFVEFLFIHGLLHLKGMRHGARMEQAEKIFLHGKTNRSRS